MHQRPSLLVLALAAAPGAFSWSVVSHARPRWVRQRIGDVAMLEAYGACTPCCLPCGSKRLSRARAWRRSDAHRGLLEGSQPGRRKCLLRQHLTLVAGAAPRAARASAHAPTDAAAARARLGGRQLGLGWAQPCALRRACVMRQVTDEGDVVLSQGAINGFLGGSVAPRLPQPPANRTRLPAGDRPCCTPSAPSTPPRHATTPRHSPPLSARTAAPCRCATCSIPCGTHPCTRLRRWARWAR